MSPNVIDGGLSPRRSQQSLTSLHWGGIVLAAVTGVIHLWLGITEGKPPLLVAGIGFVVGIAATIIDVHRQQFIKLGIPFTAGQIVLYAIGHFPADYGIVGLADKAVQAALVAILVVLLRQG